MPDNRGGRDRVVALLQTSGLSPTDDEIDALVDAYPKVRAMVDTLYRVTGVRYEAPAVAVDPRVVR